MDETSSGTHLYLNHNDEPIYKIDWEGTQYSVTFKVHEIDCLYEGADIELGDLVLDGFIKWDGCANISYGEAYQHFCGVNDLRVFCQLQVELYAKAAAVMTALGADYPEQHSDEFLIGDSQ